MTNVSDAFTGTTNTQLTTYSSNWAKASGFTNDPDIQSNQVAPDSAGNDQLVYWSANDFENDQFCELKLAGVSTADRSIGPAVRMASDGQCYLLYANTAVVRIYDYDGSFNLLATGSNAGAAGHTYRLTVTGTNLVVTDNGSTTGMPSASDATHISGHAGLYAYDDGTDALGDDLLAGPIVGGVVTVMTKSIIVRQSVKRSSVY